MNRVTWRITIHNTAILLYFWGSYIDLIYDTGPLFVDFLNSSMCFNSLMPSDADIREYTKASLIKLMVAAG